MTSRVVPQHAPPRTTASAWFDFVLWASVTLALASALVYVLVELGVVSTGNLTPDEYPAGIGYVVAACYAIGGLLILVRKRWLWIVGALINAFVIAVFVGAYYARPDVMFSAAGVLTKSTQILLEAGLLILIAMGSSTENVSRLPS